MKSISNVSKPPACGQKKEKKTMKATEKTKKYKRVMRDRAMRGIGHDAQGREAPLDTSGKRMDDMLAAGYRTGGRRKK